MFLTYSLTALTVTQAARCTMVNDEDKTIKIGWVSVWHAFGSYSNATAVLGLLRSQQDAPWLWRARE